jgi:hypothetical protein
MKETISRMLARSLATLAGLAVVLVSGSAYALPLTTLDIAGLGIVNVTPTLVNFTPIGLPTGNVIVTGGTDNFAAVIGEQGTITDLPVPTPAIPNFLVVPDPPSGALPVFTFSLGGLNVAGGAICTGGEAVGASCTPFAGSPLLLTQNANSVTAAVTGFGTVTDSTDSPLVPLHYDGLLTANFTAVGQNSIAGILARFAPGGPGFIESSWSAEFTSTPPTRTPEPASLSLVGLGLGMLGLGRVIARRRKKDRA